MRSLVTRLSDHLYCLSLRQRIPQTNVYYYKSPEHNDNYVLSFAFAFDRDGEKYQFALSYPYTYSRCQVCE